MRTIRLPTRAKRESVNKEDYMFRTSAQHSWPSLQGNTEHHAHVLLRRSGRQGRGLVHCRCVIPYDEVSELMLMVVCNNDAFTVSET